MLPRQPQSVDLACVWVTWQEQLIQMMIEGDDLTGKRLAPNQ